MPKVSGRFDLSRVNRDRLAFAPPSPGVELLKLPHQKPKPVVLVLVVLSAGLDDGEVLKSGGGRQSIARIRKTGCCRAADPDIVNAQKLIGSCRGHRELRARRRVSGATPDWMHDADGKRALEGVDDERGEEFGVDGFRDDEERFAGAGDTFHERQPRRDRFVRGFVADHDTTVSQPHGPRDVPIRRGRVTQKMRGKRAAEQ